MVSLCVKLVFLIVGALSGSEALINYTILGTTDINKTIIVASVTPTSTPSKWTMSSSRSISVHNRTLLNSFTMASSTRHEGSLPTPTTTTWTNSTATPKGFSAKYDGPPCQDVLRKTWTQFNETERYFGTKGGINGSIHFLQLLLKENNKQINDPECKWKIEVSLCQYTLSPCMANGLPVSLCREDCERLTAECKTPLNRLIGSADILTALKGYDFAHLVLPTNCSLYPSKRSDKNSCVYLGLFVLSETPEDSYSDNAGLVLVISVAVVVAVLAVVSVVVYRLWKIKRGDSNDAQPTIIIHPDILDFEGDYEEPAQNAPSRRNPQPNRELPPTPDDEGAYEDPEEYTQLDSSKRVPMDANYQGLNAHYTKLDKSLNEDVQEYAHLNRDGNSQNNVPQQLEYVTFS